MERVVGNPMGFSIPPVGYWKGDKAGLGDQWAVPNQVSQDYVFDFNGSSDYVQGPVGYLADWIGPQNALALSSGTGLLVVIVFILVFPGITKYVKE